MNFKDIVKNDINNVFFNDDEFAGSIIINGKTISVVVDSDRLIERSQKEYEGISIGEILYYIRVKEFNKKPSEGEVQIFNGKQMYITNCKEN